MRSLTQRSALLAAGSMILPLFMLGCGVNATKPVEDGGGDTVAAAKPGQEGKFVDKTESSSPLPSIDPDAVARMDVSLVSRRTSSVSSRGDVSAIESGDTTDPVIVDPADYGKVLRLFREATVDRLPMDWKVLGEIWIKYKDGGTSSVWLFRTYDGAGAYKIGETCYRGATDKEFIEILKACQERPKPAKKR